MSTLPLNDICDISVAVGPTSAVRTSFNLGLIVGKSEQITTDERVKVYSKMADLTADGWGGTEPEFLAAQKYFSQSPRPTKVAIGRQDAENETVVQAVTACREANSEWYAAYVCDTQKSDIISLAQYIDSASPESYLFYDTSDSDIATGAEGNLFTTLKKNTTHRALGQYSTKTTYAAAGIMGVAMGRNTNTAGSAYTLAYKTVNGVEAESLNSTQVTVIKNNNGNYYINRGSVYNLFEMGVSADGTKFDEVLNLDMLSNNIQTAVVSALARSSKIPQTDAGIDNLLNVITEPLEKAREIGFIAPGVWNTEGVLTVEKGDTLSRGYVIISDSVDNQSQADRESRKAPPIYILIKCAGAIEYVSVKLYVDR
ncbi:DUF3383 family protein [Limosilactobacillus oris]|uniref:DUF3383 family protein n=1 Tax=Limosilactobacillus oris TaxID=1632 RepID=UPI00242B7D06|nr:DUF3383 family protein [Limosilactobacillus oris]MBS5330575.1 DUF3383 family protein [Limosilactobacillus oris]